MIEFTLYIEAQSVQTGGKRMMHNKKTGKPVFFKDKRTTKYLDDLALLARPHAPRSPIMGAVRVDYTFLMTRPQEMMKPRWAEWMLPMTKRPDIDAFPKGLSDVLTALGFWNDDSQIIDLNLKKRYVEKTAQARIVVMIEELCPSGELNI